MFGGKRNGLELLKYGRVEASCLGYFELRVFLVYLFMFLTFVVLTSCWGRYLRNGINIFANQEQLVQLVEEVFRKENEIGDVLIQYNFVQGIRDIVRLSCQLFVWIRHVTKFIDNYTYNQGHVMYVQKEQHN
eukprot:TRINITY_DN1224_c0_g1_i4.p4 TRINITY_DN1224_c0_g1~~TRINITY_DN1224_c0_g1_i4.p4  ORF type:complete len:132 (-),score=5.42 TRINITY_DN1224_c0_g1_i4:92-487(-)